MKVVALTCILLFLLTVCILVVLFMQEGTFTQNWTRQPNLLSISEFSNAKIVASITTIPSRFHTIETVLKKLLEKQTRPVDYCVLILPKQSMRGKINTYTIPDFIPKLLQKHSRFLILNPDKDYGPISKIFPVWKYFHQEKNMNVIHVFTDDDRLPSSSFVNMLARRVEENKNAEYTLVGGNIYYNYRKHLWGHLGFQPIIGLFNIPVDFVFGFSGISFSSDIFPGEMIQKFLDQASISCLKSDDLIIGYFLAVNQIPRYQISWIQDSYSLIMVNLLELNSKTSLTEPLYKEERIKTYNECFESLLQYSYDNKYPFFGLSLQFYQEPNISNFDQIIHTFFPGSTVSSHIKHNAILSQSRWKQLEQTMNPTWQQYRNTMKALRTLIKQKSFGYIFDNVN